MTGIFGNGRGRDGLLTEKKSFGIKKFEPGQPLHTKSQRWELDENGPVSTEHEECVVLKCGHTVNAQREIGPNCPVCGETMCNECTYSRICLRCSQRVHQVCVGRVVDEESPDPRVVCKRCSATFMAQRALMWTLRVSGNGLKWLFASENAKRTD